MTRAIVARHSIKPVPRFDRVHVALCQKPAIRGRKRCRLHGGLSPGAPKGRENGNYKNGEWTAESIEERKWLRSLVRAFAHQEQGS